MVFLVTAVLLHDKLPAQIPSMSFCNRNEFVYFLLFVFLFFALRKISSPSKEQIVIVVRGLFRKQMFMILQHERKIWKSIDNLKSHVVVKQVCRSRKAKDKDAMCIAFR